MATLDREISAFNTMRPGLEAQHIGEWVLVHQEQHVGTFASFDEAAQLAVAKFGRGPYLIRQVGAPPVVLPASVRYRPVYEGRPASMAISD